jgi:beta-1,4-mannooligosaccharide/beta-1,4-mannosyl-N-acetylglucosamine phosphorylase
MVMFAADMANGCRLGVARTETFERFEFLGFGAEPDIRNGVLFPERIGGKYVRLDRPNRLSLHGGPTSGDEIWLSESTDVVNWTAVQSVMRGRPHSWDERIGSGPPPVKTKQGWLHLYHGIATHFGSCNIYQAGAVLLDLDDPSVVLARSRNNILEPRELYELIGQVPNVVFPSGMIVERYDDAGFAEPDSRVLVYYGAADTCVGLATTTTRDLLASCHA